MLDLSTRMVVGWQLATHMRTSLVVDALAMAVDGGRVRPDAIFHSDRGAQYTASEFARYCKDHRVRSSVGRTGVCWDNAVPKKLAVRKSAVNQVFKGDGNVRITTLAEYLHALGYELRVSVVPAACPANSPRAQRLRLTSRSRRLPSPSQCRECFV